MPTRRRCAAGERAWRCGPPSTSMPSRPMTTRRHRCRPARRRPAARRSARCPTPRIRLELGQWATPVPQRRPGAGPRLGFGIDAVGHPRAVGAPADLLEVLDGTAPVDVERSRCRRRRSRRGGCAAGRRVARPARRCGVMRSVVTENGEHGAERDPAPWRREHGRGDEPPARSHSARIVSSSCTTSSGGRPPSFCDRLIEPRVGWKRMPRSAAAAISADMQVAAAVRVDVQVVGRRRAARQRQLGQPDPGREVRAFLVEPGPDRVERGQPAEEVGGGRRAGGPG